MKLSIRLWVLAIALILSTIAILNLPPYASLLLFGLFVGILFSITTIKSNFGKVLIIIILLASAGFLIVLQSEQGIIIKSLPTNSEAYEQGLRSGQILLAVNGQEIESIEEYSNIITQEFPSFSTEHKKVEVQTNEGTSILYINSPPEVILEQSPLTDIKLGLDLQGGSRALVRPEQDLNAQELNELIEVTSNRLNVYGLTDLVIRPVSDLSGNNYMLIEIAGASPTELKELISEQGKFEGKIANQTVFSGGEDIANVETSGQFTGIEGCYDSEEGSLCRFRFPIALTEEAAKRQADITSTIDISTEDPEYLKEKLDLYVDDVLMDSLSISKDLKGRVTTQIAIQGSGVGPTRQDALQDAQQNMRKLQTILRTGSLPYKLEIVKLDVISPTLGKKFINTILIAGLSALLGVALVVLLRYRKIKLSLALLLTSFSEIIIILGAAAFANRFWSLDLPAIAGIIATIGTGVDHQIVILDESRSERSLSIKERLKRAMFIILGSFFTTLFAMLPLLKSGAGLLKGFALATIIGMVISISITRPAFADIVKKIID
jgi:preprotein translocase subunit SecD